MKRIAVTVILTVLITGTVFPQTKSPISAYPPRPRGICPSIPSSLYSAPSDNIFPPFSSRKRRALTDGGLISPGNENDDSALLPLPFPAEDDALISPGNDDDDSMPLPTPLPIKEGVGIVVLCALMWRVYLWARGRLGALKI
jgi:hypothetical protein